MSTAKNLDDATLRRIAYGRVNAEGDVTREQASRELAGRAEAQAASSAQSKANTPLTSDAPESVAEHDDDDAGDDDSSTPWWTRARKLAALVLAASLVVGTGIGVGADRIADALAPPSLDVFDRPPTDDEVAAVAAMYEFGVLSGSDIGDVRQLATVRDVTVYAQLLEGSSSTPRNNLGEQVCVMAVVSDTEFFFPACLPRGVFEYQGVAITLGAAVVGGVTAPDAPARSVAVSWGPNGGADVRIIDDAREG